MSARESKTATPDFEKALARLETLVKEMESGDLSLDRMMACFEEGSRLVAVCEQKLNEVEKKIEKLVRKGDAAVAVPLDLPGTDETH